MIMDEKIRHITADGVDRTETNGVIIESKDNLSKMRKFESKFNFMGGNDAYTEFERTYGKYLFVPFDIPKILPYDLEKFKSWYYSKAINASKQVEDFASGVHKASDKTYQTVDSTSPRWTPVWSLNSQETIYDLFPELFEQIHEYMPWVGDQDFRWNMWSSANHVIPHRDHSSCVDGPLAMRIKIFDSNPAETLSIQVDPMAEHQNKYVPIPNLRKSETNSFAWNNLRTKHTSVFINKDYRKILFIWRDALKTEKQMQQLADMLDRSIAKYADTNLLMVDKYSASDYINVVDSTPNV
jgi:hypothetical protein